MSRWAAALIMLAVAACRPSPESPARLPAPVGVTASVELERARVTWSSVEGADRYRVQRLPDGATFGAVQNEALIDLPAVDIAYRFNVVALRGAEESVLSEASNEVARRAPAPETVPAPGGVHALAGDHRAELTWNPVAGADDYFIVSDPAEVTQTVTEPRASFSQLRNGIAYRFGVSARRGERTSVLAWSERVVPAGVPGAPQLVNAVARSGSATVSWWPPLDLGGAAIEGWEVVAQPSGATLTAPATAQSADVSGLTNGVAVSFVVRARNRVGLGPASAPSNVVTPAEAAVAPTNVTATKVSRGAAHLSWTAPASSGGLPISSYLIRTEPVGRVEVVPSSVTELTLYGLDTRTPLVFRVSAMTAIGDGLISTGSPPVWLADAPGAPTRVNLFPGTDSAFVSWEPPVDNGGAPITAYTVALEHAGVTGAEITVLGGARSKRMTGLVAGERYRVHVRAVNGVGKTVVAAQSPLSAPLRCVPGFPNPPMLSDETEWWLGSTVKTGDFNGDGLADAVYFTTSTSSWNPNTFTIATMTEHGSFAATESFPRPFVWLSAVGVADLNGDAQPDIVMATPDLIELQLSTGTIPRFTKVMLPFGALNVDFGDIDGDGDLELVLANGDAVTVAYNLGGGGFTPVRIPLPILSACTPGTWCSSQMDVALADFDRDGKLDIATNNRDGIAIFTQVATAAVRRDIANTKDTSRVVAMDWNADGLTDLASSDDGSLRIWLATPTQQVGSRPPDHTVVIGAPGPLMAVDADLDGRLDLIAGGFTPLTGSSAYFISVVWNRASGPHADPAFVLPGVGGFEISDFDGDGTPDWLVTMGGARDFARLGLVLGKHGAPLEQLGAEMYNTNPVTGLTGLTADFDGDGKGELLFGDHRYAVVGGKFVQREATPDVTNLSIGNVTSRDIDGDGLPDLARTVGDGVEVHLRRDAGFELLATYPGRSVAAGDFDGDGRMDLAIDNGIVWNSPTGLVPQATSGEPANWLPAFAADLELDGIEEQIGYASGGVFARYRNGVLFPISQHENPRAAGDLDGDGRADIVLQGLYSSSYQTFAFGTADGGFLPEIYALSDVGSTQLVTADFDGDGDLDLLTAGQNGTCYYPREFVILWNDGGHFDRKSSYSSQTFPSIALSLDGDGDGRPDIAVLHGEGPAFHRNVCTE